LTLDAAGAYRAFAPAVLAFLRSQRAPDPEDLLGEVFLHVARSIHRFRGDDDDLRRWVFTIARNRLIDERRRRARRPLERWGEVPERAALDTADVIDPALVAALDQLTPEQREVILLRFVADLSLAEVAEITGRDVGAVKSMQHRARAQLARTLGLPGDAEEGDA
jgi:RNA polymerase sigma-70 factor (ECF subfamily)